MDVVPVHPRWGNWLLVAVTVGAFFATTSFGELDPRSSSPLVLDGFGIGVLGHVLLHADVLHLLGNMLFLWVFGNAVCARIGSLPFLACYASFAAAVGLIHVATSEGRAVGASGAISGVVGMFLVLHPKDHVTFGLLSLARSRELPAWLFVALWVVLEIAGLVAGVAGIGHAAHLVGFVSGFAVAWVLVKNGLVGDAPGPTLLDLYWRRGA